MLLGGDEFLRTQQGNNNPYCQDNSISWYDWRFLKKNKDIFDFACGLIALRRQYRVLRRKNFFKGRISGLKNLYDIKWFDDGLHIPNWQDYRAQIARAQCFVQEL